MLEPPYTNSSATMSLKHYSTATIADMVISKNIDYRRDGFKERRSSIRVVCSPDSDNAIKHQPPQFSSKIIAKRNGMAVMHKVEPVTPQGQGLLVTSERTPLLKKPSSHHRATRRDSGFDAPEEEEQVSIIQKPSTARLMLVAITSCLNIFLCWPRSTRPSPRLSQRPS
jgi:hypothetical protein